MRRRPKVQVDRIFLGKKQKSLLSKATPNETLESPFPKQKTVEPLSINRDHNMTQNGHVYAICDRAEVAVVIIFGRIVDIIEGYMAVIF